MKKQNRPKNIYFLILLINIIYEIQVSVLNSLFFSSVLTPTSPLPFSFPFSFPDLFISALISLIRPHFVSSSKVNLLVSSFTSNILKIPPRSQVYSFFPRLVLLLRSLPGVVHGSGSGSFSLEKSSVFVCDSFSRNSWLSYLVKSTSSLSLLSTISLIKGTHL